MFERKYILLARRLRCSRRPHNEGDTRASHYADTLANLILLGAMKKTSVEQTYNFTRAK